jgi:hypothetical protein
MPSLIRVHKDFILNLIKFFFVVLWWEILLWKKVVWWLKLNLQSVGEGFKSSHLQPMQMA